MQPKLKQTRYQAFHWLILGVFVGLMSGTAAHAEQYEKKGLDLRSYCKQKYGPDWDVKQTSNNANDAWACVWTQDNHESHGIDLASVCQSQFKTSLFGNDTNTAGGWYCKVKIDYGKRCKGYADIAETAGRLMESLKVDCGLDRKRFSSDRGLHERWCVSTANEGHLQDIANESKARAEDIEKCAKKIGANKFLKPYHAVASDFGG